MNGGGRQSQERENSILICKVLTGIKTIRVAVSVMVRPEPQKKQDQGDCGDYSPNAIARLYSFSPFPTLFDGFMGRSMNVRYFGFGSFFFRVVEFPVIPPSF